VNAQPKKGNIKLTISIPETTNNLIRRHCKKQGDVSRIINEAVNAKYPDIPDSEFIA
jgi:hypothetical protein